MALISRKLPYGAVDLITLLHCKVQRARGPATSLCIAFASVFATQITSVYADYVIAPMPRSTNGAARVTGMFIETLKNVQIEHTKGIDKSGQMSLKNGLKH